MMIERAIHAGAVSVKPWMELEKITKIVRKLDIGALPPSKSGRVVGLVADRNLVVRALANPSKLGTKDDQQEHPILPTEPAT